MYQENDEADNIKDFLLNEIALHANQNDCQALKDIIENSNFGECHPLKNRTLFSLGTDDIVKAQDLAKILHPVLLQINTKTSAEPELHALTIGATQESIFAMEIDRLFLETTAKQGAAGAGFDPNNSPESPKPKPKRLGQLMNEESPLHTM